MGLAAVSMFTAVPVFGQLQRDIAVLLRLMPLVLAETKRGPVDVSALAERLEENAEDVRTALMMLEGRGLVSSVRYVITEEGAAALRS